MRVFHDTRDVAFRRPYGAVAVGSPVELVVDVADAPGACVKLRTWVDGEGEKLYKMEPLDADAQAAGGEGAFVRYRVEYAPATTGIVWYQFVITDVEGYVWRYGARDGHTGGEGRLVGWEPPSFRLSVFDPLDQAPYWHGPIDSALHDKAVRGNVSELVATLLENYPFEACRTAAPWDADAAAEDPVPDVLDMAQALKRAQDDGSFAWFAVGDDVFGFWRVTGSGALTCALFNASPHATHNVLVPMVDAEVSELVGGYGVPVFDGSEIEADGGSDLVGIPDAERYACVFLWQFGSAILHFHESERLDCPMEPGLGVLAHVTSLPMDDDRFGTLGAPARAFVDWLAAAGVRYWQVLPVSPTDEWGSPYAGISAFAGNARLLETDGAEAGDSAVAADPEGYRAFCEREAVWLEPYACFMAIREKVGAGKMWQEWPKEYRRFTPSLIECDAKLAEAAETHRRLQFAFDQQWKSLRSYANEHGVQIIGDMPIYVSSDSADVWAHPELFQLGANGLPEVVAGCPPDAFAVDGQIWGNPVYDWAAAQSDGFSWWLRRLQRSFELYDYVRLDHFIGFSRYFSIPVGEKASAGSYRLGPGFGFFRLAHETLGQLPIIAEDLGLLTPRVRGLVADCGFPGMDIVQFVDGGDPLSYYEPRPEKIAYTGTHDNQTLVGFVRDCYPDADEDEVAKALLEIVVMSAAPVCILPLQDIIGLGDEARMNVPGVAEGNWTWQADADDVERAFERACRLVESTCLITV